MRGAGKRAPGWCRGGPTVRAALCLAVGIVFALAGCGSTQPSRAHRLAPAPRPSAPPSMVPGFHLAPIAYDQIADWAIDYHGDALLAFRRSCAKIDGKRSVGNGAIGWQFGAGGHWLAACRAASATASDDLSARRFFERWFVPYLVLSAGSDEGMFTGYYEPILFGSWRRTSRYTYPLYRAPAVTSGLPTRAEIENGALAGRGLELLWVDDPIAAFFLHVQGSGLVQLEDGGIYRVGFAGQNGYSYFPIGRELIRRGEILPEEMSMQAIRLWLQAHPEEARSLMNLNPSYVFFRLGDGDAPIGAQGVALTPGRSLAVDPSFVPFGVPIWLDTTDPAHAQPLRRLVVAQDTGGAIKGPVRGDLFWGTGEDAELRAGLMKQVGRYYLLLPRAAALTS